MMRGRFVALAVSFGLVAAGSFVDCGGGAPPVNQQLTDVDPADTQISLAIERSLADDQSVDANELQVTTVKGVATLSGKATNLLMAQRAVEIAGATKSVLSVVDEIDVQPLARPDFEIRKDLTAALMIDPALNSYKLNVDVDDGVVNLAGTVGSWTEKYRAAEIARGIRGVRQVQNHITVDRAEVRPDAEIAADIEARLKWDVAVDDALIHVEVNDGAVSLSGMVGSVAERERAKRDALIAGVLSVDTSKLEVKWWARNEMRRPRRFVGMTDSDVQLAVRHALAFDPRVRSTEVTVSVESGVASLEGTVSSLQAKSAAVEDAESTVGVMRVLDYLHVEPPEHVSDHELATLVSEALQRDTYVDADDIQVKAVDGTVYLEGTVRAQFEKSRAEDLAKNVLYTVDVVDNLRVVGDPPPKSDSEIRDDIETELYWNPWLTLAEVDATVKDGVATLHGTVDTPFKRALAEQEALQAGARSVENELRLRYGAGIERP